MTSRPNRVLLVIAGVVAVLAVVAAVVAATRTPPTIDASTPGGVVQTYLKAILESDHETASGLLSPSTGCDATDVAAAFVTDSARIVLLESTFDGEQARVVVDIIEATGSGPFGGAEFSHEERFTLANEDGKWLLVGEPWPLYFCDRD